MNSPTTSSGGNESVLVTREAGLVSIQLNRADHRNALTFDMVSALGNALREVVEDPGVRLVVLRAAGPDFCTGADLDEFYALADATPERQEAEAGRLSETLRALLSQRAPTIALVQGRALGFGATLAIAADVTLASSSAQIGFPEITYGIIPAYAGVVLQRALGRKAAIELLATGRVVKAEEARELGLVSRVIPDEGFAAVTGSCLRGMCACATELMLEFKDFMRSIDGVPVGRALDLAAQVSARGRASEAFREAARQFLAMT